MVWQREVLLQINKNIMIQDLKLWLFIHLLVLNVHNKI